ncbi:MAG: putative thioredoxin [Gammaproteobacteria bacterium]
MSNHPQQLAPIIDVDADSFQTEVVDASFNTAILVDFWAEWCAPCKALGPVLEKVVSASNGRVRLAKLDIDSNQQFAGSNGIRSIPTVRLFVNGAAVAEFMGAQPEQEIQAFLQQHLPAANEEDEQASPEATVQQIIEGFLHEERFEEAAKTLRELDESQRSTPALVCLAARIELCTRAAELPDQADLAARVSKDPTDLGSRLELSVRQAAGSDYDEAMQGLLSILSSDRSFRDGAPREHILLIFKALGADERVNQFRGMLANALN